MEKFIPQLLCGTFFVFCLIGAIWSLRGITRSNNENE